MRKFLIIVFVLAVAGTGLYFGKDKLKNYMPGAKPGSEASVNSESGEAADGSSTIPEPDAVFKEPVTFGSLNKTYTGAKFSFEYSDGFKVTSNASPKTEPGGVDGEIVTIENQKGSGFQIYIIPFDEPGPITAERIQKDLPDADVKDPKNAVLDGVQALVFYGSNEDMGETFEAWAVSKGKLYEISGPKTAEQLIIKTLETWRWK